MKDADWFGFPDQTQDGLVGNQTLAGNLDAVGWHFPSFSLTFTLLVLPAVIALVAENVGHVKAVAEMTKTDLDPVMGRAVAADGVATVSPAPWVARRRRRTPRTSVSWPPPGSTRPPRTSWQRLWRSCSVWCPKFGAIVNATPPAVLGGITLVLYGMIGLLGAKIWKENGVDFANPVNLVPIAAGIILAIGNADAEDHRRLRPQRHRAGHPGRRPRLPPRAAGRSEGDRRRRGGHRGGPGRRPSRGSRATARRSAERQVLTHASTGPRPLADVAEGAGVRRQFVPWPGRGRPRLNRRVPTHQLVVAEATLRGRDGRWQIGIDDGRIAAVGGNHCTAARSSTPPVGWSPRASPTATCTSTRSTRSTGSATPR